LARNKGAEKARAKILAFIDSDCSAAPGWLTGMYHAFDLGYDAVGGAVANANGESLVSWAGYFSEFREFLPYGSAKEVSNLTLGNAAYSSQAFWKAGGFPVGCFPQEDQVFHQAFRKCGFRIMFDPAIQIFHNHRTKINDYLSHQRRIGQANARVVRQLDLPGKNLARSPWLARLSLPAMVSLRWMRTLWACRYVEDGLVWKHPKLAGLLALGMISWGIGFTEEASHAHQGR
jgi:mycofactocin glycosyltransferase